MYCLVVLIWNKRFIYGSSKEILQQRTILYCQVADILLGIKKWKLRSKTNVPDRFKNLLKFIMIQEIRSFLKFIYTTYSGITLDKCHVIFVHVFVLIASSLRRALSDIGKVAIIYVLRRCILYTCLLALTRYCLV